MNRHVDQYKYLDHIESTLETFIEYELKHGCNSNQSRYLEKCIASDSSPDVHTNEKIKRIDGLASQVQRLRVELDEDPIWGVSGIILFYENLLGMIPNPSEKEIMTIACEKLEELRAMVKIRRAKPHNKSL